MNISKYNINLRYPVRKEYRDEETFRTALRFYNNEEGRIASQFKADLLAVHKVTDHPKAHQVYSLAWEFGNSDGLEAVALCFGKFVALIK